ncbi:MAG: hypothetical protein ACR2J8_05040 [Thermomicrobiales bacterium]
MELTARADERDGIGGRRRMRELAGRLAPHQERFEQLGEANRRRSELELLIAALQAELAAQNEEIRRRTIGLYDELIVDLIRCGR